LEVAPEKRIETSIARGFGDIAFPGATWRRFFCKLFVINARAGAGTNVIMSPLAAFKMSKTMRCRWRQTT